MDFKNRYGSYAIVTGASAGLGEAIAHELAARGLNLVLVARRKAKLDALANQIEAAHGVEVKPVALDLSRDDAADALERATADLDVGSIVLNAAQIVIGPFLDNDLAKEAEVFRLNMYLPFRLAHHFGNRLRRRGRGGILFVSSLIGLAPAGPFQTNYAATKAYVTSFAQGLRVELAGSGVDVTALAPGGMRTEGIDNTGYDFSSMPMMAPSAVARIAVNALGKKALVVPGVMNRVAAFFMKYLLPRSLGAKLFGSVVKKMIAKGPKRG